MTHEISLPLVYLNPVLGQALGGSTPPAQSTQAPSGTATPTGNTAPASGFGNIGPFLLIMMVGMIIVMSMSGRKEKKKRAAMLSTLGKRDKVRTAGGILGTIIEMKDDEVLIETDKSSHTRLWLAKGSVSTVLSASSSSSKHESASSDLETVSA